MISRIIIFGLLLFCFPGRNKSREKSACCAYRSAGRTFFMDIGLVPGFKNAKGTADRKKNLSEMDIQHGGPGSIQR